MLKGVGNGWWSTGPPGPPGYNNSEHLGGPFNQSAVQLFDLSVDEAERRNVASEYPEVVANLTALIAAFNASAVDPRGTCAPADPREDPGLHGGVCVPWIY